MAGEKSCIPSHPSVWSWHLLAACSRTVALPLAVMHSLAELCPPFSLPPVLHPAECCAVERGSSALATELTERRCCSSGPNCWLGTFPEQDTSSWVSLKCGPFSAGVHGVVGDAASPSPVQGGSPWSPPLPVPQVQGGALQQCCGSPATFAC